MTWLTGMLALYSPDISKKLAKAQQKWFNSDAIAGEDSSHMDVSELPVHQKGAWLPVWGAHSLSTLFHSTCQHACTFNNNKPRWSHGHMHTSTRMRGRMRPRWPLGSRPELPSAAPGRSSSPHPAQALIPAFMKCLLPGVVLQNCNEARLAIKANAHLGLETCFPKQGL